MLAKFDELENGVYFVRAGQPEHPDFGHRLRKVYQRHYIRITEEGRSGLTDEVLVKADGDFHVLQVCAR